jgi:hypothetical protein
MVNRNQENTGINLKSFREYWLRKLEKIQDNPDGLSEMECVRLKKRVHAMLQHLKRMEEESNQFFCKISV